MMVIRVATLAAFLVLAPPLWARGQYEKDNHSAAQADSAREAAAIVDAFHAALRAGNRAAAIALLADDVLIFEGGGAERTKAEYESHHMGADMEFSQAVPAVMTRRTLSSADDMAWVASEGRITGTYRGKALALATSESMVLRREDRKWKIVHIHWSSAAK